MDVFLSWSGARSKAVAEAFEGWLAQVIQAVQPWISSDIEKGTRWSPAISERLETAKVGLICLTKDNLDAPWILFEAGALSKSRDAHVCTLLLDVTPGEVKQPLGQFQHTRALDHDDVLRLVYTINGAVGEAGERQLQEASLNQIFETNWPRLRDSLEVIAKQSSQERGPKRSEREMLEEILETVRSQKREMLSKRPSLFGTRIPPTSLLVGSEFNTPTQRELMQQAVDAVRAEAALDEAHQKIVANVVEKKAEEEAPE